MARKARNRSRVQPAAEVWRFVRWAERFGPGDSLRKLGGVVDLPKYIRWHINAWEGEGGEVLVCLNALRGQRDFIWLQGALIELLTIVTNCAPSHWGLLLSAHHQPLTSREIGYALRVDGRKALAAMESLERCGLVERIDWPLRGESGPPLVGSGGRASKGSGAKTREASRGRTASRARPSEAGARPPGSGGPAHGSGAVNRSHDIYDSCEGQSGQVGSTMQNRRKKQPSQPKNKGSPLEVESKNPASAGKLETRAPPDAAPRKRAKPAPQGGQATGRQTPTTTPSTPNGSTSPDGGAGPQQRSNACPPLVIPLRSAATREPEAIGDVARRQMHRYSATAGRFADDVMQAMGFRAADGRQYANERGHWTKAWDDGEQAFGYAMMATLKQKMMQRVTKARRDATVRHLPSYAMTTWLNLVRDVKRRGHGAGQTA